MTGPEHPGESAAPGDVNGHSLGTLIAEVTRDLSLLLRQEVELAKAEVKTEVGKTGKAAGLLGGAGFAGYLVVLFLSLALWAGLSNAMDPGWAAVIVAAVWGLIGAVLGATGRTRMRDVHPLPERTVQTVQQIPEAMTPNAR